MRRQLARNGSLPLLLRIYGIKPWELDLLTGRELDAIVNDLAFVLDQREGGG